MNSDFFTVYISLMPTLRKNGRKSLLNIDNSTLRGSDDDTSSPVDDIVMFLPPNTASKIEILDAGIILALNIEYRRIQMERALDLIGENVNNIYKVDILLAMKMVKMIWKDMESSIISKSCRNSKFEGSHVPSTGSVPCNMLQND